MEHRRRPMLPHFHDESGLVFQSNLWNTRQWIALAAFSKDETLQSISSENDPILCLLDAADLSEYEKSFTNAVITKMSHLRDVRCEEVLRSLGLDVFESRRVLIDEEI